MNDLQYHNQQDAFLSNYSLSPGRMQGSSGFVNSRPPAFSESGRNIPRKLSKSKSKSERVCEAFRSALPRYDKLVEILLARGSWWEYWLQKTFGTSRPSENLSQYAARIYCTGKPAELGVLVSAFALSTDTNDSYLFLSLVDQLIISDDEYAATVEGMECILLQSKCYLDVGKPRKAWLSYHRGLALAQLMVSVQETMVTP
jgi:hypothetical protein